MCDSLLKLQGILESGDKLTNRDILARSRGFAGYREYTRYCKWRKDSGKSVSLTDNDFTSDLEWWRAHVDYYTASVFIEYAKKNGYTVTNKDLRGFHNWWYYKRSLHSNSKEYLELYIKYLNAISEKRSIEETMSAHPGISRVDAIAILLGFESCNQRRVYDKTCSRLGFSYSSDKDRYLKGIPEWVRSDNLKRNNRRSINVKSLLSSKEASSFFGWCTRFNITVGTLTDSQLVDMIRRYKEHRGYLERKNNLPWKDDFQRERYNNYVSNKGYSFKKDPERYLAEFQNWSDNIDSKDSSRYIECCKTFDSLLSDNEGIVLLDCSMETLSNLFDSTDSKYGFCKWCWNTNKSIATKKELLSAIKLYRKVEELRKQCIDICWADNHQKSRYYKYCKKLGFSLMSDPERYLAGLKEWAAVVDGNPLVN